MRDIARYASFNVQILLTKMPRMFNNEKYSDATVLIHDVTLHAHKSVICIQSAYFAKAFQEAFVEGNLGMITFDEGSGAAHWRVFEYLYTGDYSDDLSNFEGKLASIVRTLGNLTGTR